MDKKPLQAPDSSAFIKIIETEIRKHELRVALVSGIIGLIIIAGIFHAIRLNQAAICLLQR